MVPDFRTAVTPGADGRVRPLVLVGFKAYFDHRRMLNWFTGLEHLVASGRSDGIDLVALPSATALASLKDRAEAAGVVLGAQDCSLRPYGAFTGELPAQLLREVGAGVVEVGHSERRDLFGEPNEAVRRKARVVVEAAMTPFVCVGERARGTASAAAAFVLGQLADALGDVPDDVPVIVGYEPVWAIGAARPAPIAHVRAVGGVLREWLDHRGPGSRLLYGGTAGPGQYGDLADVLDGLALGRRAHDVSAFGQVLDEVRSSRFVKRTEGAR